MTAPAVTSLPSGRAVLGWWRELSAQRPHRLWFAHLLLHHVEALVEMRPPTPLTDLCLALLALLRQQSQPIGKQALAAELSADADLLGAWLCELERAGLVHQGVPADAEAWEVTAAGRDHAALAGKVGGRLARRSFWFAAEKASLYVPLIPGAAAPVATPDGTVFDMAALETCVNQSAEWKARRGFPDDIRRVVRQSPEHPDWRAVPVVGSEQCFLALVEMSAGGEVVGFPVRPDGWTLVREAVLAIPHGAAALSPLLDDVDQDTWKRAWQQWCHQRNLPAGDVEACQLTLAGHRLVVRAPGRLIERMRTARSDALKGEAWLLAGTGRVRAAAQIEMVESA